MRAEEIAQRFALGGSARLSDGPVARGMQGEVWRLDTSDGRWAVKVPFRTVTEAGVALGTLLAEAAYARGVPTPLVRRTVEGDVLAGLGGGEPHATVRVHGWVDVLPPDDQLDPGLVGATVAAMHGLDVDVPAVLDGWHHEPVGATGWDELCVAARADGAPFAGRLVALRDELVALDAWVEHAVGVIDRPRVVVGPAGNGAQVLGCEVADANAAAALSLAHLSVRAPRDTASAAGSVTGASQVKCRQTYAVGRAS